MTLILALRHKDGLVLASDSQATSETSGQSTKQDVTKLYVLGGIIAWGCAGSVGPIQRARHELDPIEHQVRAGFTQSAEDGARKILEKVNPIQKAVLSEYVAGLGQGPQMMACLFVGYFRKNRPFILEISRSGAREFHTSPYAAIGSGDIFASHALRSVMHYNVEGLTQQRALALAYRTVDDAINSAASGLGGRVQLITVTENGANTLNNGEVDQVQDLVDVWKAKEAETLGSLSPASQSANPPAGDLSLSGAPAATSNNPPEEPPSEK